MATKKGLGAKGLGIEALIHNKMEDFESDGGGVMELDLNKIEPNRKQPRKYFDETALEELATSLKNYGMIQPVVVKKNKEGYYELIAGERRWRAAKIAGLTKIPAIIKKWEEGEAFEAALVENLQREDLNPMEEAQSYQRLQEEFGLSQEQIADKSITGQKEMALWVNSQIAFSVNGMKMPNILLKEYNGVTIPLEEYMKGRKEVLVVRVNELYCSDCVNFILQKIGRLSKELNLDENILLIGSYQSSTARRYLEKNMKLPSTVFDIENGNLSLPLEEEGFPYCFLLSSDMTILHAFIPDKAVPDLANNYLKNISQRYFQTN